MGRDEFEELLSAMARAGLIEVENTEFEKDGRVIPYRRISLTDTGAEVRHTTPLPLLISDGVVEEFGGKAEPKALERKKKSAKGARTEQTETQELNAGARALAGRLREWRAAEAKRLRIPAYMVLQERTLTRVAAVRPRNPNQLLAIEGIGEAKVERFGEAILELCGSDA